MSATIRPVSLQLSTAYVVLFSYLNSYTLITPHLIKYGWLGNKDSNLAFHLRHLSVGLALIYIHFHRHFQLPQPPVLNLLVTLLY